MGSFVLLVKALKCYASIIFIGAAINFFAGAFVDIPYIKPVTDVDLDCTVGPAFYRTLWFARLGGFLSGFLASIVVHGLAVLVHEKDKMGQLSRMKERFARGLAILATVLILLCLGCYIYSMFSLFHVKTVQFSCMDPLEQYLPLAYSILGAVGGLPCAYIIYVAIYGD